jgi:hypothetical protein
MFSIECRYLFHKFFDCVQGAHCYGSYFLEYSLMAEYQLLQQQRLPGIYCMPAHSSPLIWWGVLFIRQGPYQGAVLRCVRGPILSVLQGPFKWVSWGSGYVRGPFRGLFHVHKKP